MRFIYNIANVLFGKHLFVTNVATTVSLMGFGDFIQQRIEIYNKPRSYDMRRTGIYNVILQGFTFMELFNFVVLRGFPFKQFCICKNYLIL